MPEYKLPHSFKYAKPELRGGKAVIKLCQTDRMIGIMQVVGKGGETNLHSHPNLDGMWMVLSGRIAFYGPEYETLIGEYGKYEGVLIPRGCPYWFESVGDEPAELLQVEAFDIRIGDDKTLMKDRIDYKERNRPIETMEESRA
jgi:mannose-6-phosphate isomerase-like protein (cupin superfamily)